MPSKTRDTAKPVPESKFYQKELMRALQENAFALVGWETLETGDEDGLASAKIQLHDNNTITIDLAECGFRIRENSKVFDTLDSLLLNTSPRSMELMSQMLSSKLENLTSAGVQAVAPENECLEDSAQDKTTLLVSAHEALSSERQPVTNATLTVRCIKSFEYRTEKNLVLKNLDLTKVTVGQLIETCKNSVKTTAGFKPYKMVKFDTLKLYTQAHSHKTMNLIINLENDDWILHDVNKTMAEVGAVNETEYSLFNREAYNAFKANPTIRWD